MAADGYERPGSLGRRRLRDFRDPDRSAAVTVRERAAAPGVQGRPPVSRSRTGPVARRGCEVSVFLFADSGRYGRESFGLILYFRGDLLEFRLELAPMVGTEEQFTAACQDDAQVRLGAAAVAAVSGRQRARGGQNSSHVASSLARRAVVPGSTSNQAENVPARGFSLKLLSRWLSAAGWRRMSRIASLYGFRITCLVWPSRLGCRLFMRTCPEPKWFMPGRERDVHVTPTRDRTCMRGWTSMRNHEGGVTSALPGLCTL